MFFCAMISRPISAGSRSGVQSSFVTSAAGRRSRRRIAMALEAPAHVQGLHLAHLDHLIHPAVTRHATHAGRHVRLVVKINVIGKTMNLHPRHRLSAGIAVPNRRQLRTLRLHLRMAVHADFRRRNRGIRSLRHRVMTIGAVHAKIAGMQLVTVRNGLHR